MSTYQPDATTLIRHAMVALEDQMGIEGARAYTALLRALLADLRSRDTETCGAGLRNVREILEATGVSQQEVRPR